VVWTELVAKRTNSVRCKNLIPVGACHYSNGPIRALRMKNKLYSSVQSLLDLRVCVLTRWKNVYFLIYAVSVFTAMRLRDW
jgi:hypothetical protein